MASMQTNATMLSLTPSQLATLPPNEQAQYMKGLSPSQQALVAQEVQGATISQNRNFMRKSTEKTAMCPVMGGSGQYAVYAQGQTLFFDIPNVPGFAKGLLITYNVSAKFSNSGTYTVNAAAPFNVFSELQVLYNGPQVRTHPYILKVLDQLRGFQSGAQNKVLAGNNDATIAANIVGTTPIVSDGTTYNTWTGKMYLPLNALGGDTVPGVLPLSGVGNKPQLKLTIPSAFVGNDPLLNCVSNSSAGALTLGTVAGANGQTVSQVNVDVIYLDGSTMDTPAPLSLAWQGEPTLQYTWDTPLVPFSANTLQRQTISTKLQHWYVISLIIDGVQSSTFSTLSNITGFELGPDQVGQQTWYAWNISNNVSIYDFFDRMVRRPHGQDLDPGVIPWVDAPGRGTINADNRNGSQFLNMYPGGFPAATASYQVGAVTTNTSGLTPRVETFLVSVNTAGLKVS
jgi:hypothetical protein